ncbi:MAG: class I mannose-6-phosphate isomerase [Prevotella sp.]|nr:class I mannose-6-phosphate isomerase [Prevotella sp.]MBP5506249.1 class I mannose-6-phosphate isomerase [Prevotella sp.]
MFLKFKPLLKTTLWGGERIASFKGFATDQHQVGESWEISGMPGNDTIVSEGECSGKSLNELVSLMGARLLGEDNYRRFGNEFPLLIKFIDAHQDLSIQVHPDDETARKQGKERGKTEMWYVLQSEKGAHLYNGLKKAITPKEYKEMVENDTICDALAKYEVSEGDVFFVPAGNIHSIGQGCFVVEIQEANDVTYRIYDFKRKDKNGNYRELHTQQASESINYQIQEDYRTHYTPKKNEGVQLVSCPYFTTAVYDLDEPMTIDYSDLDSFVILICIEGEGTISEGDDTTSFRAGNTILLPATTQEIAIKGTVKFLETYV